jgi:hypothetical protein
MFVKKNREKRFHDEVFSTIHFFDQVLHSLWITCSWKKIARKELHVREKNSIEKDYMFVIKIREKSL